MTLTQRTLFEPSTDNVAIFARIYDETSARVYGVVLQVVRDPAEAEEVTRDVYLQVWREAAPYDSSRGSAAAWLMAIAHAKAVERVRSVEGSRRGNLAPCTKSVCGHTHGETAGRSQNAHVVRSSLSALPTNQRRSIELAYFCGHTHDEVARLFGIPRGAAQGWITAGLSQLRLSIVTHEAGTPIGRG